MTTTDTTDPWRDENDTSIAASRSETRRPTVGERSSFNPGSSHAVQRGCRCPVLDNAHGLGARGTRGADAIFWVSSDCPMHQRMTGNEEEADRD